MSDLVECMVNAALESADKQTGVYLARNESSLVNWRVWMTAALRVALDELQIDLSHDFLEKFRFSFFSNGCDWKDNTFRILKAYQGYVHDRAFPVYPNLDPTLEQRVEKVLISYGLVRQDIAQEIACLIAREGKGK